MDLADYGVQQMQAHPARHRNIPTPWGTVLEEVRNRK